jgi:hypothetical protein
MTFAHLPDRGVLAIGGPDRVAFLQGLVSNDVTQASGRLVWAALLTPQGKWQADFFMFEFKERLLLDCEAAQIPMLLATLSRYRLRAKVTLEDASKEWQVHADWSKGELLEGFGGRDPRLEEAGYRIYDRYPMDFGNADAAHAYEEHRLRLGLPDGSKDMEAGKSVLLEAGFDELNGISWTKGCYMGQELTARTKYRGLVKRRLVPVEIDGPTPPPGSPVIRAGVEVGQMRSGVGGFGLALLRLDALDVVDDFELDCAGSLLIPRIPHWMKLPPREAA